MSTALGPGGCLLAAREYQPPYLAVLELVATRACCTYDCEFIALAQDLNVSLVTVEDPILAKFPQVAVSLSDFVEAGD